MIFKLQGARGVGVKKIRIMNIAIAAKPVWNMYKAIKNVFRFYGGNV